MHVAAHAQGNFLWLLFLGHTDKEANKPAQKEQGIHNGIAKRLGTWEEFPVKKSRLSGITDALGCLCVVPTRSKQD